MRVSNAFKVFAAVLVVIAAFSSFSEAQTRRKKTVKKPVPVAPPPPPIGDAEIISRADDRVLVEPGMVIQPDKKEDPPVDPNVQKIKDLNARLKKLEAGRVNEYDEQQKRLLLNLDILTRAEQRSESLRKQLFEMIEKENSVKTRLDQIASDLRPEAISRSSIFSGSMKPEEIRELRQKSLDSEKRNLEALLSEIQATRANIAVTLVKSDFLVDKLRLKLEKDIDGALAADDPEN